MKKKGDLVTNKKGKERKQGGREGGREELYLMLQMPTRNFINGMFLLQKFPRLAKGMLCWFPDKKTIGTLFCIKVSAYNAHG